jgi:HAD superfamily hydrolase (TIGR01549 family)
MPKAAFKAVVLDLYDTLVKWDPNRLPKMKWRGRSFPSTMPLLKQRLSRALDGAAAFDDWLGHYFAVIEEIAAERKRNGTEVTCAERFERALSRVQLGAGERVKILAQELARIHMENVRRVTFAPPERVEAVRKIAPHFRLGLLSNFDDSRTGREVLNDTGVGGSFEAVIISADTGLRKPNPAIFLQMLGLLRLGAADVLFVGDTAREDVLGAQRAGIPVAWLSENKGPFPPEIEKPQYTISNLTELPALLGI